MRKTLLLTFCLAISFSLSAQKHKPGSTYYTSSGGLKAGGSLTSIWLDDDVPNRASVDQWRLGFVGGVWTSFPLGKIVSIQPEILYSQFGGKNTLPFPTPDVYSELDIKTDYLSVPVLVKFHVGDLLAVYVGPEFDYLVNAKADVRNNQTTTNQDLKDSLESMNISAVGGIQLNPHGRIFLDLRYLIGTNDIWKSQVGNYYNQAFQATLGLRLWGKKVTVPVPLPPPPPDRDGDGINDINDKCPDVAGLAKYDGCPVPDTDKDGINDEQDKCPQVAGIAKYEGCPVPDTDKDGINDEEDKCPQVPGLARYQGCPVPDTDKDGINDEEDKCPTIAGTPENGGCPAINFKSQNIQFVSGSSTLTAGSKTELDKLVKIMNQEYPDIKIAIEGHTDNTGKPEKNQELSGKRAESVKTYLVSKKVAAERLSATGFGADQPIADNSTAAGKAKNRRVNFKVSQ
jgi:outer membrane protein OmpA-like peptidoglycan-associated protein